MAQDSPPPRPPLRPRARLTLSHARFVSLGVALAVLCAFKIHTVSITFLKETPSDAETRRLCCNFLSRRGRRRGRPRHGAGSLSGDRRPFGRHPGDRKGDGVGKGGIVREDTRGP